MSQFTVTCAHFVGKKLPRNLIGATTAGWHSTCSLIGKYHYGPWGVAGGEGHTPNPFTYTARETAEAGLMYYRARYYDLGIGRFISEDPIREIFGHCLRICK